MCVNDGEQVSGYTLGTLFTTVQVTMVISTVTGLCSSSTTVMAANIAQQQQNYHMASYLRVSMPEVPSRKPLWWSG